VALCGSAGSFTAHPENPDNACKPQ